MHTRSLDLANASSNDSSGFPSPPSSFDGDGAGEVAGEGGVVPSPSVADASDAAESSVWLGPPSTGETETPIDNGEAGRESSSPESNRNGNGSETSVVGVGVSGGEG
jgi:hypothetical protein